MIRITLACVGRLKEDYLKRAEAEFVKRLGAYCQLETKVIMEEKMPDRVSSQEERQILQRNRPSFTDHPGAFFRHSP